MHERCKAAQLGNEKGSRRRFGQVTKMRSGRLQARYTVPRDHASGRGGIIVTAPQTYEDTSFGREAASDWIRDEEKRLLAQGELWVPLAEKLESDRRAAAAKLPTFHAYAQTWLAARKVKGKPLQPSTIRAYKVWLNLYLYPAFGDLPLDAITPAGVIAWYDAMDPSKQKTLREAYSLGSGIMRSATSANGPMPGAVNPFAIDGAGSIGKRSDKRDELVEDDELPVVLETIRDEWQAMVWLALGCGLRFGEQVALRRTRDLDLKAKPFPIVKVRHAIGTGAGGRQYEKPPKSAAGIRDQRIPAAPLAALKEHLSTHATGRDGLLFPAPQGGWLASARFMEAKGGWHDVRDALGRPTLNFHDLRATGATRMARAGANVAEIQAFLGDSTPAAAMRYIRAAQSRMDDLTETAFKSLGKLGGTQ